MGADGFRIGDVGNNSGDLSVSPGRLYLDGILCELETPTSYLTQPDPFFDPALIGIPAIQASGTVLAYLDVWQRHIGVIEDPFIREQALGGPDTATRAKVVWQVKTTDLPAGSTVDDVLGALRPTPDQQGRIAARAQPTAAQVDPCIIPQSAGFRRLENQLYRVEIHQAGQLVDLGNGGPLDPNGGAQATFKWSRDNGSVVAAWVDDPQPLPNTLKVSLPTRDQERGFAQGQWVELGDDRRQLSGVGGIFVQLTNVDGDVLTFDPVTIQDPLGLVASGGTPVRPDDTFHPTVRRWDMPDTSVGPQPVVRDDSQNGGWIDLEAGVQIRFEAGQYEVGDYWTIPARTASNSIEWPHQPGTTEPAALAPRGIQHHFTCLATFNAASGPTFSNFHDCRKLFHPLTDQTPTTTVDLPRPGEFRYYLVDGFMGIGNDGAGVVGISDDPDPVSAADAAYQAAVPFEHVSAALAHFPRNGNGSTAVILLNTDLFDLHGDPPPYDDLILNGVSGYKKIVIRGTNFLEAQQEEDAPFGAKLAQDDSKQVESGGVLFAGAFGVFNGAPVASNVIVVGNGSVLSEQRDALVGFRVRFDPTVSSNSIADFAAMVLGNDPQVAGAAGSGSVTVSRSFPNNNVPGGNDHFFIDRPSVPLGRVVLGITGTDEFRLVDGDGQAGDPGATPGLSLVGLRVGRLECHGGVSGEIAFCEIQRLVLGSFDLFKITGEFTDEKGVTHDLGVGASIGTTAMIEGGLEIEIQNSSSNFTEVSSVETFTADGYYSPTTTIRDCNRFAIGTDRSADSPAPPRLVRMGANISDAALIIADSDGEVLSTQFDTPTGTGAPFQFQSDTSASPASIRLQGTGQSLRVRDVDLTFGHGATPSGVLLDAMGAVACVVNYDPTFTVSGLVALPGRTIFRPFELAFTDVRDPADNHFLSPTLNAPVVRSGPHANFAGAIQTDNGYGRSFIQRGIPVQYEPANGPDNLPRYLFAQFVGDSTARVGMASPVFPDQNNKNSDVVASRIAGVVQQQILRGDGRVSFTTLVSTGYTLVVLDTLPDTRVLPAPLFLSTKWGTVTTVRPTDSGVAVIRVGILLRVVASGGLGDNHPAPDPIIGLARLQTPVPA